MTHDVRWIVPQRVLLSTFNDKITKDELIAFIAEIRAELPKGQRLVFHISGSLAITKVELSLHTLQDLVESISLFTEIFTEMHESIANDLLMLRLMRVHPTPRCCNYSPFYVKNNLFVAMPWWFRLMMGTFEQLVATTSAQAAHDVNGLLTNDYPAGLYRRYLKPVQPSRYRADHALQDRLWALSDDFIQRAVHSAPNRQT